MGLKCSKWDCCFKPSAQAQCASTALLLLRFVAGLAFMYHGWGKIQNPMTWMGPEAGIPGIFQFLAALAEFGGGLAWILGFLSKIASLGIAITMAVATLTHMVLMKDPFVNTAGGSSYELAAVYLVVALLLFTMGPGKFSLDAKIFGEKTDK